MTASFVLAQADTGGSLAAAQIVRTIKVQKPQTDQAVTVQLGYEQNYKLDLSAIANEKITLIHLGEKLIILFDNKSTVSVEPFFDSMNGPLPNVTVEATGRDFTSSEFASSFPISTDQSILTAAGVSAAQGAPSSGANFRDTSVDTLAVPHPLPLLGQEELPNFTTTPQLGGAVTGAVTALANALPAASPATPPITNPEPDPETDNNPPSFPRAPTLSPSASVVHDETAGIQTASDPNPANDISGGSLPPAILTLFNTIGPARGNDPDIATKDNGAIGFAASTGDLVTLTGGSQNPATVEHALTVADGTFAGVSTTEGTQIFLYGGTGATAGTILGRVGTENGATDTADPNGPVAFALAVDPTNGNGYIAQYLSLQHPVAGSTAAALDEQTSLAPGAVQIQVTYGDGLGNFATSAPIDIGQQFGFQDDGPTAGAVTKNISSDGHDTNVMLVLDISGSMDEPSGLTGLTRLDVLKAAVNELFEQYGNLGDVRVQIVTFSDGASQVGSDWMTLADAKAAVSALTADGLTNYDAAVLTAESIFTHAGNLATAGVQNVSYFLSDGLPNMPSGSVGINAGEESAWTTFIDANDVQSFALGMGSGVTQSALDPLAFNGRTNTDTSSIVVTDLGQLAATLVGTVDTASGNLLTDGVLQGSFGVDGGYVKSVTADGTTYTYNPAAGGSISVSGTNHGTFDQPQHTETVTLSSGSVLTIDMHDGSFTYGGPANVPGGFTDVIPFVLADNDGDTAGNTLTIVSAQQDHPPIVRDDHVITNISGGAGTSIAIPDFALLFNDTDAESQTIAVAGISNIVGANSVVDSSGYVDFVDDNSSGGSFSYTGSTVPTGSDTGNVTVDRSQTGSTLTGTGLGEILIGSDGTNNAINANAGNDALIGGDASDTLNGGAGNDLLVGNGGSDTLNGGSGADHFRFNSSADGIDHISDFSAGNGDVIDLSGSAFGGLSPGALTPSLFVSNAGGNFSNGTQRFSYDTTGKTLYFDPDGNGAAAKIALAHLDNGIILNSTDLHIV